MQATILRTQAADDSQKVYAYLNARTTNIVNKSHFTAQQQLKITRAADMLEMLYGAKPYVNYRKTLASIKFTRHPADRKRLKDYEAYLSEAGWVKKTSPQGIIYSIKKAIIG